MERTNREYEIRPMVCDWALDIPMGDTTFVLHFNSRNNAPIHPIEIPMNNWVNRVRELDELYTKIRVVTGFTAEQLLEMFAAGYTLEGPDYSKPHTELANLGGIAQSNDPLTWDDLMLMTGQPVYIVEMGARKYWALVTCVDNVAAHFATLDDCDDYGDRTLYGETWGAYRRSPEMEENEND